MLSGRLSKPPGLLCTSHKSLPGTMRWRGVTAVRLSLASGTVCPTIPCCPVHPLESGVLNFLFTSVLFRGNRGFPVTSQITRGFLQVRNCSLAFLSADPLPHSGSYLDSWAHRSLPSTTKPLLFTIGFPPSNVGTLTPTTLSL